MKPQIYKVGIDWILWVPGVRIYRFAKWHDALNFALDPVSRQPQTYTLARAAAANAN